MPLPPCNGTVLERARMQVLHNEPPWLQGTRKGTTYHKSTLLTYGNL
jgi:hypothetical protein